MPPETRKLLIDIQDAAAEILQFTLGMDLSAYRKDRPNAAPRWKESSKSWVKPAHVSEIGIRMLSRNSPMDLKSLD